VASLQKSAALSPADKPVFEITFSRGFEAWLAEQRTSIAFTTYQIGEDFIR
jgi:hypothetical protein